MFLTMSCSRKANRRQAQKSRSRDKKKSNTRRSTPRGNGAGLANLPPEILLKIVSCLGPADCASLALASKGAYRFFANGDLRAMDFPQTSDMFFCRPCHEPFPMEYHRFEFLQGLQRDSPKDIACIWCLEMHPRKQNCSVGCAPSFTCERRIDTDEITCEWRIMRNGVITGVYISNFKNIDGESQEFVDREFPGRISGLSDGRYVCSIVPREKETGSYDVSKTAGEKCFTIRVDYDKVFDREAFFGPQLQNSLVKVCDHLKFPENSQLWDMVYCKVMNHPQRLSCHKCARAPRNCDKCNAIFDFNVQPLETFGDMSDRYVILRARILHRVNEKLRNRAKIRAIESSMPDEDIGPCAMNSTWSTAQFKLDIRSDFGWKRGDLYSDEAPKLYIPPQDENIGKCDLCFD
ncbi:hypothetical protein PAAG_03097 [Paracoccidioides lutzii Pb01]|uniref:F-box domain-containing protein n=1 Tax=Paracoccidioides lutzii (strain ATCC MYA-826 / Pb01) TaxID=502779 RepID=C1GYE3_PARBA|nr:hypothetical protein PAAG_03097 [Paracoccidioides lutzii Pb01]EEH41534.2 hypothetical protein PAAG_03097 [Paracoccidioides lutzii Pb01]